MNYISRICTYLCPQTDLISAAAERISETQKLLIKVESPIDEQKEPIDRTHSVQFPPNPHSTCEKLIQLSLFDLGSKNSGSASQIAPLRSRNSSHSLLENPPSLKKMFAKPLESCFQKLKALKNPMTPLERKGLLDQLREQNEKMVTLVNMILKQKEEFQEGNQAALEEDSGISVDLLVHELRAPLQTILLCIESSEEVANGDMAPLSECYKHMEQLVKGLPDLSIGSKMLLTLQSESFSFKKLETAITDLTKADAKKKQIAVSFDFPDTLQKYNGDYTKLVQVILNFANNAIKYGNIGGNVRISANFERGNDSNEKILKFTIADTGPGIPVEQQSKLFYLFTKGEKKDPTVDSSGVGLYLCKQFIDLMNPGNTGSNKSPILGFQSIQGKGSQFWFKVAVKEIQDRSSESSPVWTPPSTVSTPIQFSKKVSVLCADDIKSTRLLMGNMLKRSGSKSVLLAANGLEAVEQSAKGTFDIVFLDREMPKMNGIQAAEKIIESALKENKTAPHIIIITGHSHDETHRELQRLPTGSYSVPITDHCETNIRDHFNLYGQGARVVVLTKPVTQAKIIQVVNALTEGT